jgi:hypothetical protein
MGAGKVMIVLPSAAPGPLHAAYAALAAAWKAGNPERFSIVGDNELAQLPDDHAVWLFGWRNRFRPRIDAALADYAFADQGNAVAIDGTPLGRDTHSVVVMARHPGNPGQAFGWLAADRAAALPGLGRKLPHYGRYSYLAFTGAEPVNVLKGQWPVVHSPLSVALVPASDMSAGGSNMRLAPRAPLAPAPDGLSTSRLKTGAGATVAPAIIASQKPVHD